MKKLILIFAGFCFSFSLFSQAPTNTELYDFNKSRNKRTKIGLKVLGGWSLANMATSGLMYNSSKGSDKYFHQMNLMFNGINTIIVAASLLPKEKNDQGLTKTIQWQSNTEALYVANAALDLVYSTAGLYLTEKAKTDVKNHDKFKGFGNALILQGGFLFLLDTTMYIVHKRNGKKLNTMIDRITIGTSGLGLRIGYHL
ncbi:MAG: hypothetical protein K0S44_1503 [Bacteroidetes bacterium]|jgi:hypothetical protein|nr:hypothetical protein [Bacteroidota bacterium]